MTSSVDVALTRVLPAEPYTSLSEYVSAGGGEGLRAAGTVSADTIIEELVASGLRGRGGAGFPTGVKWRTIRSFASPVLLTSIVVNAAEGEPGTFKDRAIIRANPYAVIEGALIAARAMGSRSVVIATKAGFSGELARLRAAAAEISAAGWLGEVEGTVEGTVEIRIVDGPDEYLYGEETALLEVIDGRPPFPRIAPPFRRGIVEVVGSQGEADSGSGLPATVQMAGTGESSVAPPTLVNNVETMANIPAIIARGAAWFRSVGTMESPGTIVCTVTGDVRHPGVAELPMGTSLREAIDRVGGGLQEEQRVAAVLVGVSNAVLTEDQLDTELSYEAMAAAGSGLGSAGFIVVGDQTPAIGVAAGVSRFLAVESCGQCTPCKQDGAEIARLLGEMVRGEGGAADLVTVRAKLDTITAGSICSLAAQHQVVVGSLLSAFADEIGVQVEPGASAVEFRPMSALIGLGESGEQLDTRFADKQLDWTYDESDSGKTPVERFTDHRGQSPTTLDG